MCVVCTAFWKLVTVPIHSYAPMSPSVTLLIFSSLLEVRIRDDPFLIQTMEGEGFPSTSHTRLTVSPRSTCTLSAVTVNCGASTTTPPHIHTYVHMHVCTIHTLAHLNIYQRISEQLNVPLPPQPYLCCGYAPPTYLYMHLFTPKRCDLHGFAEVGGRARRTYSRH